MITLRGSLRLTKERDFDPPGEKYNNNLKAAMALCTYVCAHRLVDVMALVEGRVDIVGVPKHRKQAYFGDISDKVCLHSSQFVFLQILWQSWDHLHDWPSLLRESKKYSRVTLPQGKINTFPKLADTAPQYMTFLLSIAQQETTTRRMKISTNIDMAALNLHVMLKVVDLLLLSVAHISHIISRETLIYLTKWSGSFRTKLSTLCSP
jgi:hypothetical protein